jgi:hypothetical protein
MSKVGYCIIEIDFEKVVTAFFRNFRTLQSSKTKQIRSGLIDRLKRNKRLIQIKGLIRFQG